VDGENERYVRLYVRRTVDDALLPWKSRALWKELLPKFDRAGVIDNAHGCRGIAALVEWPVEVVEEALPPLLADGRVEQIGDHLIAPNYLEANEATQSDKQRQAECRARRRDVARMQSIVTNRDSKSQNVTECHKTSGSVTSGHAVSQPVTPSLAVPFLAEPSRAEPLRARAHDPTTPVAPHPLPVAPPTGTTAAAEGLWRDLEERRGKLRAAGIDAANLRPLGLTPSSSMLEPVVDALEAGYSVDDLRHVLDVSEAEARKKRSGEFFCARMVFAPGHVQVALSREPGSCRGKKTPNTDLPWLDGSDA